MPSWVLYTGFALIVIGIVALYLLLPGNAATKDEATTRAKARRVSGNPTFAEARARDARAAEYGRLRSFVHKKSMDGTIDAYGYGVLVPILLVGALGALVGVGWLVVSVVKWVATPEPDSEACTNLYGGSYSPEHDGGNVYCENHFTGERFLLREE